MRVAILSDIHANLAALEAVLADARLQGVDSPPWVLGDIVGYGPDPDEVIEALRASDALAVAGNHDLAAVGALPLAEFNALAAAAAAWTAGVLKPDSQKYLQALPLKIEKAATCTLVHGSPRNPEWEYLTHIDGLVENLAHFDTPGCLYGHTHVPVLVLFDGAEPRVIEYKPGTPLRCDADRFYLNPGSVGQPRDGDRRASYALLDLQAREVEFRRVDYKVEITQQRMKMPRLPQPLVHRLALGR